MKKYLLLSSSWLTSYYSFYDEKIFNRISRRYYSFRLVKVKGNE